MKLLIARPKQSGDFFLTKLKVYGRGNINLPKTFLKTLGLDYKKGGEILAEANPSTGEVILRKKPQLGKSFEIPIANFKSAEAYVLRGAQRDAEDFFKELAEGIKMFYSEAPLEVGSLEDGTVYLKLGPRRIFEEIHLSYSENPYNPKGVITLHGGVPKKTEKGIEMTPQIVENVELIKHAVKGNFNDEWGIKLVEAPKFTRGEALYIGLAIEKLLKKLFVKEIV